MNERIRELAIQARNYALDQKRHYERVHNTEQCLEEYREVYNKKFAELIIQKCVDIALDHDPFWGASVDQDIKRIFGVEK